MLTRQIVRAGCAVATLGLALSLASCGDRGTSTAGSHRVHTVPQGSQIKLAFVPNAPTAFWALAIQGLKKFEKQTGVHVDVKYPPTGKVEEQNHILEDLVSQGYSGVVMSVVAPADQVREINRACEQLNVVTTDSDAPLSNRLAFVGPKQQDAGYAAGKEIAALLPKGGKIAVFVGDLTAENAVERMRGIKSALEGKNIQIAAVKEDGKDRTRARAQVEDVITAQPDISLLVGLWSYNGPCIRDAIKASGKAGKIQSVDFDEEDGTLDGIEEGIIDAAVVLTPFEYGYRSAMLLYDLAGKGDSALPANGLIDTGFKVITKANIKQFRQELAAQRAW
jgi:ribose transport system substrate-binding protein